ncbi:MAG TPA: MBL fold metallo-hydrolase [Cyclobacteriaceae bacterium]|nr:MBL fold metallo-hydrolase [Cyclobacteriaceae bacterium]
MRFIITILLLAASPLVSFSQQGKMISEIKSHTKGTALWWAGHDSWLIKSGETLIATDLWLENGYRFSPAPVTPDELAGELDVSFITHAHDDHFNKYTTSILLNKSKCIFVIPESCLAKAKELQIPEDRIKVAKPRESFEINGIKVDPLRAIHGNANFAIYYEANLQDCGYVITLDGTTFLQPGDSYLLEDHLFLKHVDVLFFSPTEHNMYIDRSVILINTLNPDFIFPQHHGTINYKEADRFWAKGYPDEVKIRLTQELKDKYHILKPGDKFIIK